MAHAPIALPPPPAGVAGLALIPSADGVHAELAYVDANGVPVGHSALSIRNDGTEENPQFYAQRLPGPGPNFQQGEDGRIYMGGT
jgi:hypothetical protein